MTREKVPCVAFFRTHLEIFVVAAKIRSKPKMLPRKTIFRDRLPNRPRTQKIMHLATHLDSCEGRTKLHSQHEFENDSGAAPRCHRSSASSTAPALRDRAFAFSLPCLTPSRVGAMGSSGCTCAKRRILVDCTHAIATQAPRKNHPVQPSLESTQARHPVHRRRTQRAVADLLGDLHPVAVRLGGAGGPRRRLAPTFCVRYVTRVFPFVVFVYGFLFRVSV